jgi:hypothetical protein
MLLKVAFAQDPTCWRPPENELRDDRLNRTPWLGSAASRVAIDGRRAPGRPSVNHFNQEQAWGGGSCVQRVRSRDSRMAFIALAAIP